MSFSPCLACRRHVRAGDETCPFCGVAAPPPRASASPTTRLTRGALFAFATTVAACGGTETTDGSTDTDKHHLFGQHRNPAHFGGGISFLPG